jgi:two-component system, OmpR family, alkaline phosphatase synthesis response regulator PhoP
MTIPAHATIFQMAGPSNHRRSPLAQILVIEDNEDLAFGLRNNLEIEGYRVEVVGDGAVGLARTRELRPDLVVLDLMLPGLDGYRVLRQMRDEGLSMPVLILTARGEEADKVRGFRLGADDYVTKPFGVLELMARVEALLRRGGTGRMATGEVPTRFGDVNVDAATRTVRKGGHTVALTAMEFNLLLALLERRGAVVSRLELLKEVWGHASSVLTRTVDTHVAELRRKLEDDSSQPRHLLTVRKAGYRLRLEDDRD